MVGQTFTPEMLPMLKLRQPELRPRTLEEWIQFEARAKNKHEFIDKQFIKMPYARGPHNEISGNIIGAFKAVFKTLDKVYRVYSSDQKVYFPALEEGVYADSLAVCEKPLYWDDNKLLLINPILVVEVLSKSTKKYDRGDKFSKYKTLESFREYVLVDQYECRVETHFREEPGLWRETVLTDPAGSVQLRSIGISISLADIYEHIEFE